MGGFSDLQYSKAGGKHIASLLLFALMFVARCTYVRCPMHLCSLPDAPMFVA